MIYITLNVNITQIFYLFNRYHFYLSDIKLASGKGNVSSLSLVRINTRWKELFTIFRFPSKKEKPLIYFLETYFCFL